VHNTDQNIALIRLQYMMAEPEKLRRLISRASFYTKASYCRESRHHTIALICLQYVLAEPEKLRRLISRASSNNSRASSMTDRAAGLTGVAVGTCDV